METKTATARTVRLSEARRSSSTRKTAVSRAREAQRQLRARQERFAHLKRMYD